MENNSLTSFYDNLKSNMNSDKGTPVAPMATTAGIPARTLAPAATPNDIINHKLMHHCNKLREDCRKHLLLDIYVKILPLDDDFKTGHMGMMKNDIDCMLANKGMNATQYLTSCSEATKAPLLEYLMRATDLIARQYLKEAEEEIKDAKENGVSNPEVKEPSIDDQEVQDQLVDLKKDSEYKTFVDELKAKTVNKIVNDVSALIDDKKDESDMTFDPVKKDEAPVAESTFMVGMDYLQKKMGANINESVQDEMIGLAIRESALNIIDLVFNQKSGQFNEFASRIRWGKGVLINESTFESDYEIFTKELGAKVTDKAKPGGEDNYTSSRETSITIPESVTEIKNCEFMNYKLLKTVKFPKNLKKIGNLAFKGCKSLRDITIPASVTEIGSGAFENCSFLHTVKILGKNVKIAKTAFLGTALTKETIDHLREFEPDLRGIFRA